VIRHATQDDVAEIARLGAIFHEQAGWSEIPYSEADCAGSLGQYLQSEAFICLVAETDTIVGMAAGAICPVYFNAAHVSGEELFWWVSDKAPQMTGIRLLEALEGAAKAKGCKTWQMKSLARLGGERMQRLYERRGYRASERLFIKEL
jgi:hypothetical protein